MSKIQGISFLHEFDLGNRLDDSFGDKIISVTSTAVGDFDKSNLFQDSTRLRWRSADTANQEIVLQADISSNIDTFAIIGHNLSDSAAVQLQANIANNFLAPPVTVIIPITEFNMMHTVSLGAEYEFYKLTIIDPANPCGYIEIGRIVAGRAFTMAENEDITDSYSIGTKDMAKKMKTEGFFKASNENVLVRTFNAQFQKISTVAGADTNFLGLRNLFRNVRTTRPFLTILDRGNPGLFNVWGELQTIPGESYGINQFVSMPLSVEEVF